MKDMSYMSKDMYLKKWMYILTFILPYGLHSNFCTILPSIKSFSVSGTIASELVDAAKVIIDIHKTILNFEIPSNLRATWENTPSICLVTVVTSNLCCFGISPSPDSFKAKTASDSLRDTSAFCPGFLKKTY